MSRSNNRQNYHVVSAFVSENKITLGELMVNEKSNEITAVPELLELLNIEDAIVTADAMSCQKTIAETIIDKNADYVLSLKENQPTLLEDAAAYFAEYSEGVVETANLEKDHGRIQHRRYSLLTSLEWLDQRSE